MVIISQYIYICVWESMPSWSLKKQIYLYLFIFDCCLHQKQKKTKNKIYNDIIEKINVLTNDGKTLIGTLKGFDQFINIILEDAIERVYSPDEGVEEVPLGLYLIRGDNITLVGEIDNEIDSSIDLNTTLAYPIGPVIH